MALSSLADSIECLTVPTHLQGDLLFILSFAPSQFFRLLESIDFTLCVLASAVGNDRVFLFDFFP